MPPPPAPTPGPRPRARRARYPRQKDGRRAAAVRRSRTHRGVRRIAARRSLGPSFLPRRTRLRGTAHVPSLPRRPGGGRSSRLADRRPTGTSRPRPRVSRTRRRRPTPPDSPERRGGGRRPAPPPPGCRASRARARRAPRPDRSRPRRNRVPFWSGGCRSPAGCGRTLRAGPPRVAPAVLASRTPWARAQTVSAAPGRRCRAARRRSRCRSRKTG